LDAPIAFNCVRIIVPIFRARGQMFRKKVNNLPKFISINAELGF
jgi:hypothetical protein